MLGRFLVTNYRIKFIENGKHKNLSEMYDSSSIPFGLIKNLAIAPGGNQSIDIITKDYRILRFKFSNQQQLSSSLDYILKSTQVRNHQSLFAYKFKDGVCKKNQNDQKSINKICIKEAVMKEYMRFGA